MWVGGTHAVGFFLECARDCLLFWLLLLAVACWCASCAVPQANVGHSDHGCHVGAGLLHFPRCCRVRQRLTDAPYLCAFHFTTGGEAAAA
jgi:hypothetical protein